MPDLAERRTHFQMMPDCLDKLDLGPTLYRVLQCFLKFPVNYSSLRTVAEYANVSVSTARRCRNKLASKSIRAFLPEVYRDLLPADDETKFITLGGLSRAELHPVYGTRYVTATDLWALNVAFFEHAKQVQMQAHLARAPQAPILPVKAVGPTVSVPPSPASVSVWRVALQHAQADVSAVLREPDPRCQLRFVAHYLYALCNAEKVGGTFKTPLAYAIKHRGDERVRALFLQFAEAGPSAVAQALTELAQNPHARSELRAEFPAKAEVLAIAQVVHRGLEELGLLTFIPVTESVSTPTPVLDEETEVAPPAESLSPAESLWQAVLTQLRLTLPAQTFTTWLRGAQLARWSEQWAVVTLPTSFARDWVDHSLRRELEIALATALHCAHIFVEVRVADSDDGSVPSLPAEAEALWGTVTARVPALQRAQLLACDANAVHLLVPDIASDTALKAHLDKVRQAFAEAGWPAHRFVFHLSRVKATDPPR